MSDLINSLSSFFTFLFTQLGNIANFFTTNTLGIIILALSIFGIIVNVACSIFNHFHK